MLLTQTSSSSVFLSHTEDSAAIYHRRSEATFKPQVHPPGLQALFDSLAHGIWVVDVQCRVHYSNPIAQQINKTARCLELNHGLLQTVHKPDQHALGQSIQKATRYSSQQNSAMRSVLRIRVIDTKPPTDMLLVVTPLHGTEGNHTANQQYEKYSSSVNKYNGLAAIQLQKTALIDPAMLCLFARSYKLTNTEELVLSLLCDGLDAPEVAATLNVAVSTVRTHVRALCGKMQANSIRQLVVKTALLPGMVGVHAMV